MKKGLILCLLLCLLCLPIHGQEDFTYDKREDGIWITGSSLTGAITIPAAIDGTPVVGIGKNAFQGRSELTAIALPEGLRFIEAGAFENVSGLKSPILVPDSVERIGRYAFSQTRFSGKHYSAAHRYALLTENARYTVTGSVPGYQGACDDNGSIYWIYKNEAELVRIGEIYDHTVEIPENVEGFPVTAVGSDCLGFFYREQYQDAYHIAVPGSVRVLKPYAFDGARVESVYLGEGVKEIGAHALALFPFASYGQRIYITLPRSIEVLTPESFALSKGSNSLSAYVYPETEPLFQEIPMTLVSRMGAENKIYGNYCGFSYYIEEDAATIYNNAGAYTMLLPEYLEGVPVRRLVMSGIKGNFPVLPRNAVDFQLPVDGLNRTFLIYPGSPAHGFCIINRLDYQSVYPYWGVPFSDVSETQWYYEPICYVYYEGLMNGTGQEIFSPNGKASRAMVVTVLWRLAGCPAPTKKAPFTDVEEGSWYMDATNWAWENDIVKGISEAQFAPNSPVTRQQLAALLMRFAGGTGSTDSIRGFADWQQVSSWAQAAMGWAWDNRIMTGELYNGALYLKPQNHAKRSEIAAMLMRMTQ